MIPFMGPEFVAYLVERCDDSKRQRGGDEKPVRVPPLARECSDDFDKPKSSLRHRLTAAQIRALAIASLGSALEFYDFIVFVFLANVIGHLFFPADLPAWVRQVETFGIFAAGYLARPIGGLLMGHLGDLQGRKRTFTLSVLLMAVPTLLIGCLPTYHTIGAAAPLLLLLLRVCQGAAIGGEAPAAWVFVAENAPLRRQGLAVGLLTSGLSSGILLGSLTSACLSSVFTPAQILDGAWRLVFILGGIFGLVTVMLRRRLAEAPIFRQMRQCSANSQDVPIRVVLKHYKVAVALSMAITWTVTAIIIVVILMGPALLHALFAIPSKEVQIANVAGTLALCLSTAVLGALSDRFGLLRVMGPTFVLSIVANYLLFSGAYQTTPYGILLSYILAGIGAGAIVLTPIIMIRSFPTSVRVTGVSFSYNVAFAVLGGLTPPLVAWLSHLNHLAPAHYTALAASAALAILLFRRESTHVTLEPVVTNRRRNLHEVRWEQSAINKIETQILTSEEICSRF